MPLICVKKKIQHNSLKLLGNSYYGQREFRNALNYYEQFLKTDPTNAQIWFNSAMAYLELKENENACDCLIRSSELGMKESSSFLIRLLYRRVVPYL